MLGSIIFESNSLYYQITATENSLSSITVPTAITQYFCNTKNANPFIMQFQPGQVSSGDHLHIYKQMK